MKNRFVKSIGVDKLAVALNVVEATIEVVLTKRRVLRREMYKAACKQTHIKQFGDVERDLAAALAPMFERQIRSMSERLGDVGGKSSKSAADSAASLVGQIFDPREWRDELIDRTLPVLAVNMFRAAAATLLAVGVDVRKSIRVAEKRVEVGTSTTASEWLNDHPGDVEKLEEMLAGADVPIGIVTEMPTWMKESIAECLTETFREPYWDRISEATGGDAERYLRKGLEEGWSIQRMASTMAGSFQGETAKYAKMRATRIARTESGNALNGARDASYHALKEELGEAGKFVGKSWLSVLGNTTRDTHADADGQLADEDGNFTVGGYSVPWPGHFSLPPGERISCQCTILTELGVGAPEEEIEALAREQEGALREEPKPEGPLVEPEAVGRKPLDNRLNNIAGEIQDLDRERLIVLNEDGSVRYQQDGTRDSITLTEAQEKELRGRVSIHNHPGQGMPFSPTDVSNAILNGELESHVCGPNGVRYKMDFRPLAKLAQKEREKLAKKVKGAFSREDRKESAKLAPLIREGKMKIGRDTAVTASHNAWKKLADRYGFVYSGEPGVVGL